MAFDFDGTIINCESRQTAVLRAALLRYGVSEIDIKASWVEKRNGASTIESLIHLGLDKSTANKVGYVWHNMVEDPFWLMLDTCFDDSCPSLDHIRTQGFRTILLTARQHVHWLIPQLNHLNLIERFDTVKVVTPKNASEEKGKILRFLKPSAFFGDTESDWIAAQSAGVPFFCLDRGQRSASFLGNRGIKPIWKNLKEAITDALSAAP